jgi:hypothetical protein
MMNELQKLAHTGFRVNQTPDHNPQKTGKLFFC